MIVVCEGCERRFQLDDSRIPAKGARVRCKYCHHRFRVPPPGGAPDEARDPSAPASPSPASASGAPAPSPSPGASASGASAPSPSASDTSPANSGSGLDTLFGTTGGAPIDGDRSLFGTSADVERAEAPGDAPAPPEEEPGGISQDLRFVMEPPSEAREPGEGEGDASTPPEPGPLDACEPLPSVTGGESSSGSSADALSNPMPDDTGSDAVLDDTGSDAVLDGTVSEAMPDDTASDAALDDSASGATSHAAASGATSVDTASSGGSGEAAPSATADEASRAVSEDAPLAAGEADELPGARTAPPGGAASAEESGGEDAWEFADSSLSFGSNDDEDTLAPGTTSPPVAAPAEAGGDTFDGMQLDPGASHPEAASDIAAAEDAPSLRAVAPGAGPDSAMFEMAADDAGEALELAADDAPVAAAAGTAAADDAPADAAPAPAAEIGSLEDWERLDEDDDLASVPVEPAAAPPEPETSISETPPPAFEPAPDPDWPTPPDDLPRALPATRRSNPWLEHAGWMLSLVLLLSVAQGTVRVEPANPEPPPGRVEVAGLVAENVRGRFVENAASGTLFVVSGELHNRGATPRAGAALQVVVVDEHGFGFEGRDTPVGLILSEAMVRETPLGALRQHQARLARTLGERTLAPGEGVSFQAIVGELPKGAVRFRLEPAPAGAARAPGGPAPGPAAG